MKEKRGFVLKYAVEIESIISQFLAHAINADLDCSSIKNMSFLKKVELLTDIRLLSDLDKRKLRLFSQIRNKFAHNIEVADFSSYFKHHDISGQNYAFLKSTYPSADTFTDYENELEYYFVQLYTDLDATIKPLWMKALLHTMTADGNRIMSFIVSAIFTEASNGNTDAIAAKKLIFSTHEKVMNKIERDKTSSQ